MFLSPIAYCSSIHNVKKTRNVNNFANLYGSSVKLPIVNSANMCRSPRCYPEMPVSNKTCYYKTCTCMYVYMYICVCMRKVGDGKALWWNFGQKTNRLAHMNEQQYCHNRVSSLLLLAQNFLDLNFWVKIK